MSDPITPALTPEQWSELQGDDPAYRALIVLEGGEDEELLHIRRDQNIAANDAIRHRVALALLNESLRRANHPAAITRAMADAVSDALYQLHGPKMDGPRNDTERALLDLGEILNCLLPPNA